MTLEERIAYYKQELAGLAEAQKTPRRLNISRMPYEEKAQLKRPVRISSYSRPDEQLTGRHRQYTQFIDSEDYSDTESLTQPNASMTIEEIYKRISQGKPIAANAIDVASKRNAGYDSDFETREESLEAIWNEPFTSPAGTLDRVQEMNDRVARVSAQIVERNKQLKEQSEQSQVVPDQSSDGKRDYQEERAAAKATKRKE